MKYIIAAYVLFMMLYWIEGSYSDAWTLAYYSVEKIFSASGYILLALYVYDKRVSDLAIYAASVCVFMTLYFVYCYFFSHDTLIAVTSFLFYSLIILYLIKK